MNGQLVIKPQRHPTKSGQTPLTYAIFLETSERFEGIECWQDCDEIFVAYSWTEQGALRAIEELEG